MIFVLISVIALLVLAIKCWMYFRLAAAVKKQKGVNFLVVEKVFGFSLWTLLCDMVLPDKTLDALPFWSTVRISQNVISQWRDADYPDFVAVVSFWPLKVEINCTNSRLARDASEMLGRIDKMIEGYDALNFFGRNIVTTSNDEWKKHRKICTGAFTKSNLRAVKTSTKNQVSKLMDKWDRSMENGAVEIRLGGNDDLMMLTLAVFGESIFGSDMKVFENDVMEEESFGKQLMISSANLHVCLIVPKVIRQMFPSMRKIDFAFDFVRKSMTKMLETAKLEGEGERNDLLSLLSRSNQRAEPLSEDESVADVWIFSLAGTETSAHTIGWLIMRLAFHQELQSRLFEEVNSIADFVEIASDNAPFLYAFVHETLRLHPPANTLPLLAREEGVAVANAVFQKGWIFNLNIEMIQQNPKLFQDPLQFNPDRFLEDGRFQNHDGLVAFNVGPRSCLGKQVALMEIAVAVASIVSRYQIFPVKSFGESSEWISKVTREFKHVTPFKLVLRK